MLVGGLLVNIAMVTLMTIRILDTLCNTKAKLQKESKKINLTVPNFFKLKIAHHNFRSVTYKD